MAGSVRKDLSSRSRRSTLSKKPVLLIVLRINFQLTMKRQVSRRIKTSQNAYFAGIFRLGLFRAEALRLRVFFFAATG
jgi:hypothetical protein